MLAMTDEAGDDKKILAVPISKLTAFYDTVHELGDLPITLLRQIEHFFAHYKDLETGKWVKIQGWVDKAAALRRSTGEPVKEIIERGNLKYPSKEPRSFARWCGTQPIPERIRSALLSGEERGPSLLPRDFAGSSVGS